MNAAEQNSIHQLSIVLLVFSGAKSSNSCWKSVDQTSSPCAISIGIVEPKIEQNIAYNPNSSIFIVFAALQKEHISVHSVWVVGSSAAGTRKFIPCIINSMVRHGTQKKRRAGFKVTRKPPKHRTERVANSVTNVAVKKIYDKNKTPSENLAAFGLASDVNNLKGSADSAIPLTKHAAFVGFGQVMEGEACPDKNPKRKRISEVDSDYAAANIAKHGDDYKAMERDIKVNVRQSTARQMEKLCVLYLEEKSD